MTYLSSIDLLARVPHSGLRLSSTNIFFDFVPGEPFEVLPDGLDRD
jgi:hypothetical protein